MSDYSTALLAPATAAGRFRESFELKRGEFIRQSHLRAADDVSEFGWFALDELPEQMAFEHEWKVLED